jgi:CheY-like chemotaxis protein
VRHSTLCVAFKRETGLTPSEYIRAVRVGKAARLLRTTQSSIKEIWALIGYNHASDFNHDFRRLLNASPRVYRSQVIVSRDIDDSAATKRTPDLAGAVGATYSPILVVDDDESTRMSLQIALRLEGYSVSVASDGADGLAKVDISSPGLVLLDYHLGDMTGLEFLRHLRARATATDPAVILMTADWNVFDYDDEWRSLRATVASKLCDLDEICRLILKTIRAEAPRASTEEHTPGGRNFW